MQFRQVKVGERYYHLGERQPCVAIEKRPTEVAIGRDWPEVVLEDQDGQKVITSAGTLEPWDEYLAGKHELALRLYQLRLAVDELDDLLGGGLQFVETWSVEFCRVKFTELAAERLLALCQAKPLPEARRPSEAPEGGRRQHLQDMLGRRLRRALGYGRSGIYMAQQLDGQETYMAQLEFTDLDLDAMLQRLSSVESDAALSALLA